MSAPVHCSNFKLNPSCEVPSAMSDAVAKAYLAEARSTLDQGLAKILHCINQLPEPDLHWRPFPTQNSISNIILHLCGNTRQWIIAPLTSAPDHRDRAAEFSDRRQHSKKELLDHLSGTIAEA